MENGAVRKKNPLVSAVIPAYDAAAYVGQAIESVLSQTYAPIECLVVDDGSTDGTAEVAAGFGERVKVLSQENRGVAVARNRGAREAKGALLAFLDADDRWLPDRVERQVGVLADRPEMEAVVCATRVVDRTLLPLGLIRQARGLSPRDLLLCRAEVVSVSSNLLIKRASYQELGGFDERLSTSADWALLYRLVERQRLEALPEALVEYRRHEANMSASIERFERDMLMAFEAVFADPETSTDVWPLRRRAFANLHRMIAGSYFVEGRVGPFARHAARSIVSHPSTLPYFFAMPFRRLRRALAGERQPGEVA
jgi:glycosyltransferase involved in cell wall biosynthesis